MTASIPQDPGGAMSADALDPGNLDGHTVEELSAYLDADRTPTNFSIESSAGCQIALAALGRLRDLTQHMLEAQAAAEPAPPDGWVRGIMERIALEARAGRDIPISHAAPTARLSLTEGAVRGLIRAAGDSVPEVIVGRCRLDGDVTIPGEPVTVTVDVSVAWGTNLHQAAERTRAEIRQALATHTELAVTAIDVNVQDVRYTGRPAGSAAP